MARRRWKLNEIQQVLEGQNPFIQVGYAPHEKPNRDLGEIWTDARGDTWEQRQGYRMKVNKQADSYRDLVKRKCSKCGLDIDVFGDHHDEKYFRKTGKCADCVLFEETSLMVSGKFDEYETKKLLLNQLSYLRELHKSALETIKYLESDDGKVEWVTSQGDVVTWKGKQNEPIIKAAKEDIVKIEADIVEAERRLAILNEDEVKTTDTGVNS